MESDSIPRIPSDSSGREPIQLVIVERTASAAEKVAKAENFLLQSDTENATLMSPAGIDLAGLTEKGNEPMSDTTLNPEVEVEAEAQEATLTPEATQSAGVLAVREAMNHSAYVDVDRDGLITTFAAINSKRNEAGIVTQLPVAIMGSEKTFWTGSDPQEIADAATATYGDNFTRYMVSTCGNRDVIDPETGKKVNGIAAILIYPAIDAAAIMETGQEGTDWLTRIVGTAIDATAKRAVTTGGGELVSDFVSSAAAGPVSIADFVSVKRRGGGGSKGGAFAAITSNWNAILDAICKAKPAVAPKIRKLPRYSKKTPEALKAIRSQSYAELYFPMQERLGLFVAVLSYLADILQAEQEMAAEDGREPDMTGDHESVRAVLADRTVVHFDADEELSDDDEPLDVSALFA